MKKLENISSGHVKPSFHASDYGCSLPVTSCDGGSKMHNERETARIECGTDQFGDNVNENKGGNKKFRDIEVQII